ncbi:MAG TPA: 5,10-methylenetetrahydromethanopterin reductase, partial [Acidimicrobiaceae bacterium]|nr:5,10-methylenetetrahydromethanopterin reductase [Acidimicrobiaceae bacterium]
RCWVYDEGLATRDLYVTMTAIAQATNRLEIGPGITNAYSR